MIWEDQNEDGKKISIFKIKTNRAVYDDDEDDSK